MHTLYIVYDETGKVTDYLIDTVDTTKNFISLAHGTLSYVKSIVDNLKAYSAANGDLNEESQYIISVRHGNFDETYGKIEDKSTNNPNYTSSSSSSPAPSSASSAASSAASNASSAASQPSSAAPGSAAASTPTQSK